ncbi:CRISPR-associated endonuclease Cas3'' [Parvibaculum sedimenti]|uniref:CRISPR-associated endonuclease Cas3 n=1 Tax=Parvibaculum sedimenti TaxID=2608632 RepID=A0A6N6VM91_9HYPH|nr:CRISPR-associated endonuclease Cas3'' [Parvibaculum sedimenti]KAB7742169.1 CRISPR-associated endonuclease Cas3'' [Parvibaculum sedimenti]
MPYFAHSGTSRDKSDWQPLQEHLLAVAKLASDLAEHIGLDKAAYLAGLFHDLGKYNPDFQRRLEGQNIRVDHSTAGAALLKKLVAADSADGAMVEFIAYGILGHHAGLPDRNTDEIGCFERRIERYEDKLDPVWRDELAFDLARLMPNRLMEAIGKRKAYAGFDFSVVVRFLFSCLVDADFKDTERFYSTLDGRQPDRHWASLQDMLPEFLVRFNAYMTGKRGDGDINQLRGYILTHVRGKAGMSPGLFTLTVPTGGGKTLASLGFALDHAKAHGHRRIIYTIPFTSIVDQTADIFRDVLSSEHILEHHSAIDEEHPDTKRRPTSRDRLKLAMEDWAAPIVITTNVQLFESLFATRTSKARKLHNIAGSIIILDEAQTIPRHLLIPCVRMLDTLACLFGCTIVLCTATQPALGAPGFPEGLDLQKDRELAPDPHDLALRLRRARIERVGEMDNHALIGAIGREPQALVIVNSRKHALELYREGGEAGLDGLVHLTTRQCAAHRREILTGVRKRLKDGRTCRVIATSLIEAGVDVDFPKVWRAEAGLDSIVQAAGRCNREGRNPWQESVVTVFSTPDYKPPREIAGLIGDMSRMVDRHDDLLSLDAIENYFGEVYWRAGSKLDERGIFKDFVINRDGADFAFRTVAEKFRMIESRMEPVIIQFDDRARKAVAELSIEQLSSGSLARKLQSYVVQVPPRARALLIRSGHVTFVRPDLRGDQFAVLKSEDLYKDEIGLLWEDAEYLTTENSII